MAARGLGTQLMRTSPAFVGTTRRMFAASTAGEKKVPMDGCEAAAYVAYALSETSMIYPITPSSSMGEFVDEWVAQGRQNIWGQQLSVTEMQSEAGAAGALHGAVAAGSLATTFTASQGLLLMIPNMYKIAGELTPCVVHVAARALAGQALSIYGDHADVMAARTAGFNMLASGSVQEVMDLGTVAHLATLKCSLPFMHFFEGFRVSHEVNSIETVSYDILRNLIDMEAVKRHRQRALNPEHPHLRGTSQTPDVFFQMVESSNSYYDKVPGIVAETMQAFGKATGRNYGLFDYSGAPDAEYVCVCIGSGAIVMEQAGKYINEVEKSGKVGVLKVRLFRPFSVEHFLAKLPKTTKRIVVLDRCKENGAPGEPLYLDVRSSLYERTGAPIEVYGGRYGLGSKDFTPSMAKAVFANVMSAKPKNSFSIGIVDDVTNRSVPFTSDNKLEQFVAPKGTVSCLFWGVGADGTVGSNKSAIKTIVDHTPLHGQAYFYYSAHKSGGMTVSHLRFGPSKIDQPYLLQQADYVACHTPMYLEKYGSELVAAISEGGNFVVNCPYQKVEDVEKHFPSDLKQIIGQRKLNLYTIDASKIASDVGMPGRTNSVMQAVFFHLSKVLPADESVQLLKKSIEKDYGKKGKRIVEANWSAVDASIQNLVQVKYPAAWKDIKKVGAEVVGRVKRAAGVENIPTFVKDVMFPMIRLQGDNLPVSVFPKGGMIPLGTSQYEKRCIAEKVPKWLPDKCSQCSYCSMVCPHACIRPFLVTEEEKKAAPKGFDSRAAVGGRKVKGFDYRIQTSVLDCTGCNLCAKTCPDEALVMEPIAQHVDVEADIWDWISKLPHRDATGLGVVKESQFKHPYLEFSGACGGCAQTNVVKLVTQFFGESMVIANATGCSTIWGGTFPNSPYTVDERGYGPAWANSLFEDNAEFGLGIYKAHQHIREGLKMNLEKFIKDGKQCDAKLKEKLDKILVDFMDRAKTRVLADQIKALLKDDAVCKASDAGLIKYLKDNSDGLAKKSQWIFGGDGWAYDIGFGGLDHVLATGEDVNVLVLDTEVYSNTGGQRSKATSRGAVAKFCATGKETAKKDLGKMMMSYGNVYVASAALGADMKHLIKVIKEAESYNGPSLLMTYTTCIAHGIKGVMNEAIDEQKLAVESGYWMLYHYDPRRRSQGLNPLVVDMPEPKFEKLDEFLKSEVRFTALGQQNASMGKAAMDSLKKDLVERWQEYKMLAAMPGPDKVAAQA